MPTTCRSREWATRKLILGLRTPWWCHLLINSLSSQHSGAKRCCSLELPLKVWLRTWGKKVRPSWLRMRERPTSQPLKRRCSLLRARGWAARSWSDRHLLWRERQTIQQQRNRWRKASKRRGALAWATSYSRSCRKRNLRKSMAYRRSRVDRTSASRMEAREILRTLSPIKARRQVGWPQKYQMAFM